MWRAVLGVTVLAWACACGAQEAVAPDATVAAALGNLSARATDVFVGQVVGIARKGGVVEVSFRMDQPVVGAQGGVVVLREWAGLWPPGQQRYFLGERAMVFAGAASAAGLRSPVDGVEGVVPVSADGQVLDVTRLQARVERSVGTKLEGGAMAVSDAAVAVRAGRAAVLRVRRLPVLNPRRGGVLEVDDAR